MMASPFSEFDIKTVSFRTLVDEADTLSPCHHSNFILDGLRAAKSLRNASRPNIMEDIATILDCRAADLNFLFQDTPCAANDMAPVDLPDFRDTLMGMAAE